MSSLPAANYNHPEAAAARGLFETVVQMMSIAKEAAIGMANSFKEVTQVALSDAKQVVANVISPQAKGPSLTG
jgi:hypothetical protein